MKKYLLLFLPLLFLLSLSAFAHSAFVSSEPKAGATLSSPPNEIRMRFSEPLKVGLSSFAVRDAQGHQVDRQDLHADAKEPALLHLSLPPALAPGLYQVTWSAVAADLHVSKGSFSFRVNSR